MIRSCRYVSLFCAALLFGCNAPATLPQNYNGALDNFDVQLKGGHDVRIQLAKIGPQLDGPPFRLWPQREHQVQFDRFTITLPKKFRWIRATPSGESGVAFVTQVSPLHTISLAVHWTKPPEPLFPKGERPLRSDRRAWARWQAKKFMIQAELLRLILASKRQTLSSGALHLLSFKASPIDAKTCQRYEARTRDVGVPGHLGEVFIMTVYGMVCIHPDANFLVLLDYSARRPNARKPLPSLRMDAEKVFKSLHFIGPHITSELLD